MSPAARLTIFLGGMVAGVPHQGGASWAVLQYALGLRRLGHDVWLVEELSGGHARGHAALARSTSGVYFRALAERFGLEERSALLVAGTETTLGAPYERLREAAGRADLLLNVSGLLQDERLVASIPIRAYLDLDPAFAQVWHEQGIDVRFEGHNRFMTVGQAIGTPESPVPTCGIDWIPSLPPVVLEQWPPATPEPGGAFTTVGNWRGYGSVEHQGVFYGQKAHSLRKLIALPTRTNARLALALNIDPGEEPDLEALERNRWRVLNAAEVAGDPDRYQAFIRASKAELGVAKSGYVESRCGWFSDRSACYLATGRPVVAQETGFSSFLPTGDGLLSFSDLEGLVAGIEEIEHRYQQHASAARALAREHLDSDRVLPRLIERILP